MSQARRIALKVVCEACDAEETFPTIEMAIMAQRMHLCEGEVPSCSWPGWEM
jgi:hypothetical protein